MKRNKKQNIRLLALILILLLGIGFAALAANLKINGTVNVSRTSWDVHFENVSITEGSVTANPEPTTNNTDTTEMTYTINFTKPGDFYEFTVDIVNAGTIDAMVNSVTNKTYNVTGTTEIETPTYLINAVNYDDDIEIAPNHLLEAGESEKIKVRIEFKKDISSSDLPSSGDTSIVFKFKGDYKQADENAIASKYQKYNPGDLVYYNPVTQENCNESTYDLDGIKNGTSTCYKWRVIKVGDSRFNDKITIQLDHNIVNKHAWSSGIGGGSAPIYSYKALEDATSEWSDELKLTHEYNLLGSLKLTCTNGICKAGDNESFTTNLKARMITAEEVRALTMYAGAANNSIAANWTASTSYANGAYYFSNSTKVIGTIDNVQEGTTGNRSLDWLLENTTLDENSGATANLYDDNNKGYWTLSPTIDTPDYNNYRFAWGVDQRGELTCFYQIVVHYYDYYGIRPVIEIEKSKLN